MSYTHPSIDIHREIVALSDQWMHGTGKRPTDLFIGGKFYRALVNDCMIRNIKLNESWPGENLIIIAHSDVLRVGTTIGYEGP